MTTKIVCDWCDETIEKLSGDEAYLYTMRVDIRYVLADATADKQYLKVEICDACFHKYIKPLQYERHKIKTDWINVWDGRTKFWKSNDPKYIAKEYSNGRMKYGYPPLDNH